MKKRLKRLLRLVWGAKELWATTLLAAWSIGSGLAYLFLGHYPGIIGVVLGITVMVLWRRLVKRYLKSLPETKEQK